MPSRHHPFTITLHWLTVGLLVLGIAAVLGRELCEDKALKTLLLNIHRAMGLLVLCVCVLRLASRWPLAAGKVNAGLPKHLRFAAHAGHSALYAGLLAIPLLGWLLSNARGQTVHFLGLLPLPSLVMRNRDLADQLEGWHENLAWALMALAAAHALAALWHHYHRKDQVLRSILPLPASRPAQR